MGEGGGGTDYETRGGEGDANSRERRGGTAMGEPHARCHQEELAPGEERRRETHVNLERMGHAGVMMMPALETPRLSLNLLKWLYSHCICSPKTGITLLKNQRGYVHSTFIRNYPSSFAPSSSVASTLPRDDSVSEPHPSSRE
jgi:hypothetical protein